VHADAAAPLAARPSKNVGALQARAMQVANSQLAAVGQTCFFLYMFTGGQLSLIGVYMMLSMGTTPLRNMLNVRAAFAGLDAPGVSLLVPKAIYLALNAAGTAFVLYKLVASGLLPVTSADWFTLLPMRSSVEHAALGNDATA
jgi:hypothetical protein